MLEVIHTDKGPAAIGPYSQAIKAGGFVYVSGQLPFVPETGELLEGTVAQKCAQAAQGQRPGDLGHRRGLTLSRTSPWLGAPRGSVHSGCT